MGLILRQGLVLCPVSISEKTCMVAISGVKKFTEGFVVFEHFRVDPLPSRVGENDALGLPCVLAVPDECNAFAV